MRLRRCNFAYFADDYLHRISGQDTLNGEQFLACVFWAMIQGKYKMTRSTLNSERQFCPHSHTWNFAAHIVCIANLKLVQWAWRQLRWSRLSFLHAYCALMRKWPMRVTSVRLPASPACEVSKALLASNAISTCFCSMASGVMNWLHPLGARPLCSVGVIKNQLLDAITSDSPIDRTNASHRRSRLGSMEGDDADVLSILFLVYGHLRSPA